MSTQKRPLGITLIAGYTLLVGLAEFILAYAYTPWRAIFALLYLIIAYGIWNMSLWSAILLPPMFTLDVLVQGEYTELIGVATFTVYIYLRRDVFSDDLPNIINPSFYQSLIHIVYSK
ncbi:hypothetical protein [Halorhabdus sp. BNX81]|uniref:hypothetical protein n=1 Tax=Halorhabdus sp. BNX81 TaxID=2980181 RepID=UPI0023DCFD06|nr:hypothetical protein [Halorhabdus sp. BNX81]